MKVALIDTDKPGYEYSLAPVARLLVDAGHEVMAVYSGPVPPSDHRVQFGSCSWALFDHGPLESFDPDRVVIFNGYHRAIHAAARFIEKRWKTLYMEHGWLPQREFNYIDPLGTGGRSSLAGEWEHLVGSEGRVNVTRARLSEVYRPGEVGLDLPRGFILVPMQLERDTSIVYDSPYFKSMPSLVAFVRKHFPEFPIVVKLHPMDPTVHCFEAASFSGVKVVRGEVSINDLTALADFVIGINSTSLIEALVHEKRVGVLGRNVATGKGVFYERMWTNPRGILKFSPNPKQIWRVLDALYHAQYPRSNPPPELLDRITNP